MSVVIDARSVPVTHADDAARSASLYETLDPGSRNTAGFTHVRWFDASILLMRRHMPPLSTPVAETNSNPLAGNVTCTDGTMDRTDPSFATVTTYATTPA